MKKRNLAKKFLALFFIANFVFWGSNVGLGTVNAVDTNLPSQYSSPRLKNKYQTKNGPCWAFATNATLETFLNKKGLLNGDYLSEQHMLALCNHTSGDIGWNELENGGNFLAAKGYLASGLGPVSERDCPYKFDDITFKPNLLKIKPVASVYGIKNIEVDVSSIKKAIAKYGAVNIAIPVDGINLHAISVVGWDDLTKNWIAKDSARHYNNYVHLPYSTKILEAMCITDAKKFDDKLKRYQHDKHGATGSFFDWNGSFTVANVFDFNGNETLESIMINSMSPGAKISLYLAPVLNDGSPNANRSTWHCLYGGYVPYDGYFTVPIQNKIQLNKEKYAIIAQMEPTCESSFPSISCMIPIKTLNLDTNTPGKSFILQCDKFCDVTSLQNLNSIYGFSIKAETRRS